jgi:NTE family protein
MNTDTQQKSTVGLCLSGGGFRASLVHLGALRRLHELGILQQVDTLSTVSGGSILAGHIADRLVALKPAQGYIEFDNWEEEIARPFRRFVSRDFRTFPILCHLLWNWAWPHARAAHLVRRYQHKLLGGRLLQELPEKPTFVFCATNMQFGVNWRFERDEVGDYMTGSAKTPAHMPLALAVAASACFPPVFGPIRVKIPSQAFKGGAYHGKDRDRIIAKLSLTDGGVYDNMGIEPVLRGHDCLLVSDCGAPIPFEVKSTPIRRTLRYSSLIMKQVGALRKRLLMTTINDDYESFHIYAPDESHLESDQEACPHSTNQPDCRLRGRKEVKKKQGAYWAITGCPEKYKRTPAGSTTPVIPRGYSQDFAKQVIGRVRTDLDKFIEDEVAVLENHGYLLADAAVQKYTSHLIRNAAPLNVPHPNHMDNEDDLRIRLADSDKTLLFWKRWFMK